MHLPPTPCRVCFRPCVFNKFSHFWQKFLGRECSPFRAIARKTELSAGRHALWSCTVAKVRPSVAFVATDLTAPERLEDSGCVECATADNTRLIEFADARPDDEYDLIFAAHTMCTCRCAGSPIAFARAWCGAQPAPLDAAGKPVARTCGGLPLSAESVDGFVRAIALLLRPDSGIAIFDQEAGWPFGLETRLRGAAEAHGLHFSVRRGPLWTNTNYVLSAAPLVDDVSQDVLQRSVRSAPALHFTSFQCSSRPPPVAWPCS